MMNPESQAVQAIPDDVLARQLWAVGDAVRIRILRMLPRSPDCEHGNNVTEIAARLGISQPTTSHHLRILRQAGFVEGRRMCRDVYYWVNQPALDTCTDALAELARSNRTV
jgi:ArsR family transcriptional regulator, arsenate/arsenite/antimonite-responsive transcriptional repressor